MSSPASGSVPASSGGSIGLSFVRWSRDSRPELIELVTKLLKHHPGAAEELIERHAFRSGDVARVVAKAHKDIDDLTHEPAWIDKWSGDGNVPDYSSSRIACRSSWSTVKRTRCSIGSASTCRCRPAQVGESNDEGETAAALADSLDVVFKAIPSSTLRNAQKLLYVIGMQLRDEYDLTAGAEVVWEADWPQAAWSEVADELLSQLDDAPKGREDDFTSNYRRDRLTTQIAHALDEAGRQAEAQALLEAEAKVTGSYGRVVNRLLAAGSLDDAAHGRAKALPTRPRNGRAWPPSFNGSCKK